MSFSGQGHLLRKKTLAVIITAVSPLPPHPPKKNPKTNEKIDLCVRTVSSLRNYKQVH